MSPQNQLPFGEEIYHDEIQERISKFSKNGFLNEDEFNRDLGLVNPKDPFGQRDLDHTAAHGTHILDLAAGHDPNSSDAAVLTGP